LLGKGGINCVHPLGNDLTLKMSDDREDVDLEHGCRVGVRRIDPLRGAHERNAVSLKFGDELGEVDQRPG
jgi:hypothetical protein